MDIHENTIQKSILDLAQLDKIQKESLNAIDKKMGTEKCIELTTNMEKTYQQRMDIHENTIQKSISDLKIRNNEYTSIKSDRKKHSAKSQQIKKIRQKHKKDSINNRSILIANIKSNANPNITTEHFFREFQIPHICLNKIKETKWTLKGKMRMIFDNSNSTNWIRKIISQQLQKNYFRKVMSAQYFKGASSFNDSTQMVNQSRNQNMKTMMIKTWNTKTSSLTNQWTTPLNLPLFVNKSARILQPTLLSSLLKYALALPSKHGIPRHQA
jgi:hypothetical protein